MSGAILVIAMLATGAAEVNAVLTFKEQAITTDERVLFGDVASIDVLPDMLRDRAAQLELMKAPKPGLPRRIQRDQLADRARVLMPGLASYLPRPDPSAFVHIEGYLNPARALPAQPKTCVRVNTTIAAGTAPLEKDFSSQICTGAERAAAWYYDARARALRAAATIPEAAVILAPSSNQLAGVREGQDVRLRYHIGPVTIEREGQVLRAARSNSPMLVRTQDGAVIAAPAAQEAP
jgi:hypothetical protein